MTLRNLCRHQCPFKMHGIFSMIYDYHTLYIWCMQLSGLTTSLTGSKARMLPYTDFQMQECCHMQPFKCKNAAIYRLSNKQRLHGSALLV